MDEPTIQQARKRMGEALKKVANAGSGKNAAGLEAEYVEAARALARVDPSFILPRRSRRK